MKELKLSLTHYKLLDTIDWLNKKHLYASATGIFKIVHGEIDEDTVNLRDCPTFATLISYPSKKVARYLLALFRYQYIIKIYEKKTDKLYYSISALGIGSLEKFHKRHPQDYKKATKKFTHEIVEIIK